MSNWQIYIEHKGKVQELGDRTANINCQEKKLIRLKWWENKI